MVSVCGQYNTCYSSERQETKEFPAQSLRGDSLRLPVNVSSGSQNAQAKVNLDSYPKLLLRKQRN